MARLGGVGGEKYKDKKKVEMGEKWDGDRKEKAEDARKEIGSHDRFFFLITYPRTASNLLVRILALEKQPNAMTGRNGGYFFLQHVFLMSQLKLRTKHVEEWTQEEKDQMKQSYQDSFKNLQKHVQTAKAEGKILFVKEHACFMTEPTALARFRLGENSVKDSPWTVRVAGRDDDAAAVTARSSFNETILPDEFLKTWLPTFLIRHPALVFSSYYRTIIDNDGAEAAQTEEIDHSLAMTLHWTRTLYDFYTEHFANPASKSDDNDNDHITWPLVLDANDIMTSPEMTIRFSKIVGLDPSRLQFTWSPASEQELAQMPNRIEKRMLSTILASSGVMKEKNSADLDVDTEAKKWREEFEERAGGRIEKWVRDAMPDYEYMKAKRWRPRRDGRASASALAL